MAETKKKKEQAIKEPELIAVTQNFTTIPNSNSEFCIYTYKAETESLSQIARQGFFDSANAFLNVGDTIRVFRFNFEKKLTNYLEHIVMDVDRINKKVITATVLQVNLEKRI